MDATHDSHNEGGFWKFGNTVLALVFATFAGVAGFSLFYQAFTYVKPEPTISEAAPAAPSAPAAPGTTAPSTTATAPAKPAAGTPVEDVVIKPSPANPLMYDTPTFTVKTGKQIRVTLTNESTLPQPHNMVICKPGTKDKVLAQATAMLTDPNAMAKSFIPESPDILWHTTLVNPKDSQKLEFTAPAPGDYPYFCTFPGHAALMNGTMKVVE